MATKKQAPKIRKGSKAEQDEIERIKRQDAPVPPKKKIPIPMPIATTKRKNGTYSTGLEVGGGNLQLPEDLMRPKKRPSVRNKT